MSEWKGWTINIALFTFVLLHFCMFETFLWPKIFGQWPSPLFWFPILVYLVLNRPPTTFFTHFIFFYLFLKGFTLTPFYVLTFNLLFTVILLSFIKQRLFPGSDTSFFLMNGVGVILWNMSSILTSLVFEDNSMKTFDILSRIAESGMTIPWAMVCWQLFQKIDEFTLKSSAQEWGESRL